MNEKDFTKKLVRIDAFIEMYDAIIEHVDDDSELQYAINKLIADEFGMFDLWPAIKQKLKKLEELEKLSSKGK